MNETMTDSSRRKPGELAPSVHDGLAITSLKHALPAAPGFGANR